MLRINPKDALTTSERMNLMSEINSLNFLDQLSYSTDGCDYSIIIKLKSGFLFKPKYSNNFIFIDDYNFT